MSDELRKAYETLKIPFGTPPIDVKRAYYALAKTVHPDRLLNATETERTAAEEQFKQLNDAYHTITNSPFEVTPEEELSFEESLHRATFSKPDSARGFGNFVMNEDKKYREKSTSVAGCALVVGLLPIAYAFFFSYSPTRIFFGIGVALAFFLLYKLIDRYF